MVNIKLLRAVQAIIRAVPDQVDMEIYTCGTVGCIAGHTVMLTYPQARFHGSLGEWTDALGREENVGRVAALLLGITTKQREELFCSYYWPEDWRRRYLATTKGSRERGLVVADYIDYFIAQHAGEVRQVPVPVGKETPGEGLVD